MAMISVTFPDNSLLSFDRARRQLIITNTAGAVITAGAIPARPNPPSGSKAEASALATGAIAAPTKKMATEPVRLVAKVQKLGHKKHPIFKSAIWNERFIKIEPDHISYHAGENDPPKNTIQLNVGCNVRVVQANEPARKDRFEDNDTSMGSLMTAPMGAHMSLTSGPIGKDHCVELHVPVRVENMLNTVMGSSPLGLAYGGGMKNIQNSRARTYYFACESEQKAKEVCDAITANLEVLAQKAKPAGEIGNGQARGTPGCFAGLDNAINQMSNQKLMQSPDTSFQYYKMMLGSKAADDVVYETIISFYDQLAAVGVGSPYR